MDRRFNKDSSKESTASMSLRKKLVESPRPIRAEPVPDLTDLMNDWFFGTADRDSSKTYNLTDEGALRNEQEDEDDSPRSMLTQDDSPRNSNSRLTQEWLDEAKRMVASSPSRCNSPARLGSSPRFAAARAKGPASSLDRRDPLSRTARRHRHRSVESFSGEILSKSTGHSRNHSESFEEPSSEKSPSSAVHQWFSSILGSHSPSPDRKQQPQPQLQNPSDDDQTDSDRESTVQLRPPRQPHHRKSRFQSDPSVAQPIQSRRTFKTPANAPGNQLLSPPKNLVESNHRRSISSSTCSLPEKQVLSPPRNLVQSAHRRSISSATCSVDKISSTWRSNANVRLKDGEDEIRDLNGFLKEQRAKFGRISDGEISAKAKIVLSGSSNSTSSMVAAICYSWLLEKRVRNNKEEFDGVVVPVMNIKRGRMWKQRQAAWLFHHAGVDATTLLFSDEVDLESLMMARRLSILVIGQDVLKTNGEVGSWCTILTDNYCEDAYDLLQIPILKKLLLAGILLDTQNLNTFAKLSMARDAEAVQLLLVDSSPNYRNTLFDQLMQDQMDSSFIEALRHNYGKPLTEGSDENGTPLGHRVSVRKSTSTSFPETVMQTEDKNSSDAKTKKTNTVSPNSAKKKSSPPAPASTAAPTQAPESTSRGKNTFFLAKWFGFGSK